MQTAVVVTRYFGGIKLGAGGLVRAYSGCAAENLDTAQKVSFEPCVESLYKVDYSGVDTALRFFGERGANVLETQYLNEVLFRVAVKEVEEQSFNGELINRLNGRVKIDKIKGYYFPFKV